MNLNPSLVVGLIFAYSLGHVCHGHDGGMVGVAVASGISFVIQLVENYKTRK